MQRKPNDLNLITWITWAAGKVLNPLHTSKVPRCVVLKHIYNQWAQRIKKGPGTSFSVKSSKLWGKPKIAELLQHQPFSFSSASILRRSALTCRLYTSACGSVTKGNTHMEIELCSQSLNPIKSTTPVTENACRLWSSVVVCVTLWLCVHLLSFSISVTVWIFSYSFSGSPKLFCSLGFPFLSWFWIFLWVFLCILHLHCTENVSLKSFQAWPHHIRTPGPEPLVKCDAKVTLQHHFKRSMTEMYF